jgi:methionyl-tRNA formyltransferase
MRIVYLTYDSIFSDYIGSYLIETLGNKIVAIVVSGRIYKNAGFIKSAFKLIKNCGILYSLYLWFITDLYKFIFFRKIRSFKKLAGQKKIPIIKIKDINSIQSIEILKNFSPSIIYSAFFNQVLDKEVLAIPSAGCLNFHPSPLPRYRGPDPIFWQMSDLKRATKVTLHQMSEEIDAGNIVYQTDNELDLSRSLFWNSLNLWKLGGEMLVTCLNFEKKEKPIKQNSSEASYHSWPTAQAVKKLLGSNKKLLALKDILEIFRS